MPDETASPKLQAFMAHAGIASRRKSEELITEGKVFVNGTLAHIGQRVNPAVDEVIVEGKKITKPEEVISFLINKPAGIVSTTSDELGRETVIDYLRRQLPTSVTLPRLYPVGILDLDSEGLMILTNNGDLAHRFTHPSFEVKKTYRVTVEGQPTEKALAHLERGVRLQEGMTAPAEVEVISTAPHESILEITIHEGRYHQVKRMLQRVGYEVLRLIRTQMGEYQLSDLDGKRFKKIETDS
jgi:23S rRNA pseudouridine2605 synthase